MPNEFVNQEDALTQYDSTLYRTPIGYTSDNVIFTIVKEPTAEHGYALKLMLIQRSSVNSEGKPNIEGGKWALPGGFIEPTETAYEAAQRELAEETGVHTTHLKHFGVYDKEGRDPRGWILSNAHYAVIPEHHLSTRKAGDDAVDVQLFTMNEVSELALAFDHRLIINDALHRIQLDMLQTTLAKEFLPLEFTIGELRGIILSVSEKLADEVLLSRSFFWQKAPKLPFIEKAYDRKKQPKKTQRGKNKSQLYVFNDVSPIKSIYR